MEFIPVPNCAEIVLRFMYNGQQCANVYHVRQESPYDQTSLAVVAALFADWWNTNFKPNAPNTLALVMIVARSLEAKNAPAIEYTSGMPMQGGDVTHPQLPNNCTVAVKWSTALRGRSFRGRTYHLGLNEDIVTGNTLSASAHSAFIDWYNALLIALDGLPSNLVVVSRFEDNAPRTVGIATDIQAVSIDTTVDSQRRRLPGRGS